MSVQVTVEIQNERAFNAAIARAKAVTDDLRIPLTLIAKRWFKGNQAIFQLAGTGKYDDLAESYKKRKQAKWGFTYPILKASGALERSITQATDSNAVSEIINKDTLLLGTRIEYGIYHQSRDARSRLPRRPFLFVGDEPFAPNESRKNPEIWLNILNDFVVQKLKQQLGKG